MKLASLITFAFLLATAAQAAEELALSVVEHPSSFRKIDTQAKKPKAVQKEEKSGA